MGGAACRYGVGSRMKLKYTRAIIDAIHSGELSAADTQPTSIFELQVGRGAAACMPADPLAGTASRLNARHASIAALHMHAPVVCPPHACTYGLHMQGPRWQCVTCVSCTEWDCAWQLPAVVALSFFFGTLPGSSSTGLAGRTCMDPACLRALCGCPAGALQREQGAQRVLEP